MQSVDVRGDLLGCSQETLFLESFVGDPFDLEAHLHSAKKPPRGSKYLFKLLFDDHSTGVFV